MTDDVTQCSPVFRVGLDGAGGLVDVDDGEGRWTHYRLEEDSAEWLAQERRIPQPVAEALLVGDARPRALTAEGGLLVILRGVNCNPGADPEDMVSMRAWVEADRIVTVSPRRVFAVEDVHDVLQEGCGPVDPGAVLVAIMDRLVDRMRPIVDGLEETADDLHERLLRNGPDDLQRPLGGLRHSIVLLRRHMAPQRDALTQMSRNRPKQFSEASLLELLQIADRQIRYVEDLDSLRERAGVLQDEVETTVANRLNSNMYLLSIVAAVFLPLGFLTGLLGINVGGMPGMESPWAFWVVCSLLFGITVAEIWWLRRRRMF